VVEIDVAWPLRAPFTERVQGGSRTLRKSYATLWNAWTLVEAMDNKMGRRFKKARNVAPMPGPHNPPFQCSNAVGVV
jgi:hypothetical protein